MVTWLSPHFSLEELTVTQQRRLNNTAPSDVVAILRKTAERMEDVRRVLGDQVIMVTSGYRSPAVNRAVGGARRSAHLSGHAVDFCCHKFGAPKQICDALRPSPLLFDQLIEEGAWTHISFAPANRRQVLTKTATGYALGLRR